MKRLCLLVFSLWTMVAFAKNSGIPTSYMNNPAIDLVRNGKHLLPDEVHELMEKYKGRFDISTLNPVETSDLWKNTYPKTLPVDNIPVNDMDEVTYHSNVLTESGIFRFNIQNKSGDGKLYTMMMSPTNHSILLAKSLLRKLGYQIPDVKRLPRVILKFKSLAEKKGFFSYIKNVAMLGSAKGWIVEDLNDTTLLVQDLLIMGSSHIIYNLAVGVKSDMIQGRRLLSSLAVPLTLVDLPESINLFRWNAGVESNKRIFLFHDDLDSFECSWEDARWISKRIEKLTREDWDEIVSSTDLPKPIQMSLLERLISRRNSVMKLFKIDAKQFKVDGDVSSGVELVKGKITQKEWPGYATTFATGDKESPLSGSELRSWIYSRVQTTLLDSAVSQINQLPYLGTDINEVNKEYFQKKVGDVVRKAIEEKRPAEIPLKSWIFPTVRGQLILSRNLVTGTHLGTDGLLQLVDTVGVAVGAGAFLGTNALPTPLHGYASAEALLVRSYTHLRPVTSIQKSLKYPFKNILVPLVKMDYGKLLHEATLVSVDPNATAKEREAKIKAALRPFKEAIEVGESLLVTDSLGTYAGGSLGAGYKKLLSASLGLVAGHVALSRFHVHRKSENEFQVYKDLGHSGSTAVTFGLDSLVPVLNVNLKKSGGNAKVQYYSLNMNPLYPNVIENVSSLRTAILRSTTGQIEENEDNKPYVVKHNFKEYNPQLSLIFWQWFKQNSSTDIGVTTPDGEERFFKRHYYGQTKGRNYQGYANALISHWIKLLFDKKAGLSEGTGTNPGYSFKGRAKTKFLTFDQEVTADGEVMETFMKLTRVWNGWSINRKQAEEVLEEMKARYRYEFYNAPVLNDTRKIFLYNISLNILMYKTGIDHFMALEDEFIKEVFRRYRATKDLSVNPIVPDDAYAEEDVDAEDNELDEESKAEVFAEADANTGSRRFLRLYRKYKRFYEKGREDKANKYLLKAFSYADERLSFAGLAALAGGVDNLYLTSRIDGFREGDENYKNAIVSSSLGEIGSPMTLGPIVQLQGQTRMLEGEFFIYWLMTRLL